MSQKKVIIEELEALDNLRNMAENYEEIAATRMQRIKDSVLQTRGYLSELSEVYVDLKSSYQREVKDLLEKRGKKDKTLPPILQKNGKTLIVYMSSNGKLYGTVTKNTYNLFIEDLKKKKKDEIDLLLIGSSGKEMYEASNMNIPFEYIDIPDDNISLENIKKVMSKFLKYKKVDVYHGSFINVVRQSAISSSITGDEIFEKDVPATIAKEDMYVFEPSFEKVFHFFETQIMSALFKQTYSENQLARQASRVNAMEAALVHIEEEAEILNRQKIRAKHLIDNKKQIERMSGFVLWDID
jgi:ATP synthase F1 gamma subunit